MTTRQILSLIAIILAVLSLGVVAWPFSLPVAVILLGIANFV